MTQSQFGFLDMTIQKFSTPSSIPKWEFIFFHGFPSSSGQYQEMARMLSHDLNADVHVAHYPGLNLGRGKFTFTRAVDVSMAYSEHVFEQARGRCRLGLFGHSWGGFVAANVLAQGKVPPDLAILLAPFGITPPADSVDSFFRHHISPAEIPNFSYDGEELLESFAQACQHYAPLERFASAALPVKPDIFIVQGRKDTVLPYESTREYVTRLSKHAKVTLLENDEEHAYANHRELADIIVSQCLLREGIPHSRPGST